MILVDIKEQYRKVFNPLPEDQKELGYKPNFAVKSLRTIAGLLIRAFRLNSNNRLIVELQQMLDPTLDVPIPGGGHLTFVTGHGRLLWKARTLLTEDEAIIDWIDSFDSKDILYDIGANIGTYSLYAAKRGIKTVAFEPEINNLQLLYANTYKNKLYKNCIPVQIACDSETKVKPFYIRDFTKGDAMHTVGRKAVYLKEADNIFIQETLCMKLDDIIETFELPQPTKLKIDVDTNELNILEGAEKTLENVKEIYIELDVSFDEHKKAVVFLQERGFKMNKKSGMNKQHNEFIANYIFMR